MKAYLLSLISLVTLTLVLNDASSAPFQKGRSGGGGNNGGGRSTILPITPPRTNGPRLDKGIVPSNVGRGTQGSRTPGIVPNNSQGDRSPGSRTRSSNGDRTGTSSTGNGSGSTGKGGDTTTNNGNMGNTGGINIVNNIFINGNIQSVKGGSNRGSRSGGGASFSGGGSVVSSGANTASFGAAETVSYTETTPVTTTAATTRTTAETTETPRTKEADSSQQVEQTQRYLELDNQSGEKVKVWLQFRTQTAENRWEWLPADPTSSDKAMVFEIEAGKKGYVEREGQKLMASRIRIWTQASSGRWEEYKAKDLWLVPEEDKDGTHRYFAAEVKTFSFVFPKPTSGK